MCWCDLVAWRGALRATAGMWLSTVRLRARGPGERVRPVANVSRRFGRVGAGRGVGVVLGERACPGWLRGHESRSCEAFARSVTCR